MKTPSRTRCGNCNAKIRLRRDDWEEFKDDAGSPIGIMQKRTCGRCGYAVVAMLGTWMTWRDELRESMH